MWFYVDHILISYQVADAAAHDRPRGNLSDLYPRWPGARELLRHNRNPYGDAITVEIQQGWPRTSARPHTAQRSQRPAGVRLSCVCGVFAGAIDQFAVPGSADFFSLILIFLTAASVWWWLSVLRWRAPLAAIAVAIIFSSGSSSAVQGIKLQQLSLVVAALLGWCGGFRGCRVAILRRRYSLWRRSKPQLAGLPVAWLLLWAVANWGERKRLVFGFGSVRFYCSPVL